MGGRLQRYRLYLRTLLRSVQPVAESGIADRRRGDGKNDSLTIDDAFGYRLINVPDINHAAYSTMKIPEQEFTRMRACDRTVQASTSGGQGWQEKFKGISD